MPPKTSDELIIPEDVRVAAHVDPESFFEDFEEWMLFDPFTSNAIFGLSRPLTTNSSNFTADQDQSLKITSAKSYNEVVNRLLKQQREKTNPPQKKFPLSPSIRKFSNDVCLNYGEKNNNNLFKTSLGLPCDLHPKYRGSAIDASANWGAIRLFKNKTFSSDPTVPEPLTEELLMTLSMLDFFRLYRNASVSFIGDPNSDSPVLCITSLLHTNNCHSSRETLADCVGRIGGLISVSQIVPPACLKSAFWKWFKNHPVVIAKSDEARSNNNNNNKNKFDDKTDWRTLKRGKIPTSTVAVERAERMYTVPPEDRTASPFTRPVYCTKTHVVLHPIGYGIPLSSVVDSVPRTKAFDFMPVMPAKFAQGFVRKFGIEDELIYREWYSSSYFAWSNRRGGFETLRHYEILASGAIPFMPDIEAFPVNSLTHFPKELLARVLKLPGVDHIPAQTAHPSTIPADHEWYQNNGDNFHIKKRGTIDAKKFNRTLYFQVADELLAYTRKYLTCGAVVAGMLKRMGKENAKHVLVSALTIDLYQIWQGSSDSYMVNTVLQGFNELGINVTMLTRDYALWRYKMNDRTLSEMSETARGYAIHGKNINSGHDEHQSKYFIDLYGEGTGYKARAPNRYFDEKMSKENRAELTRRVLKREFDLVVFDFIENEMRSHAPLIESVSLAYDKSEVAIVDLFDHHVVKWYEYPKLCDIGTIFVRELDEKIVCIIDHNRAPPTVRCPIPSKNETDQMYVIEQSRGWGFD